ncbi:XRE family transcriptional regulator [Lactiplantibacillus garii]|uniref:XRE family transcriptional regulator n=1 Tax=Lactiplantibacillus garii TaxID=2306423 RepID=A0A426DAS1_9LACO|nr:helix-turn-helix transcriptional regulator [Lactiplantibacillus garii]RRK11641.1 XRE family transcriptional regulator [Lactiplantibacillus garii]
MLLPALLKLRRHQHNLTQGQLAAKLYVTTQAVSKWETGKAVPSIDNLLALSDLYNVSLDELVQGSPFFKKPYIVGRRFSFQRGLVLTLGWLLISLFFTGFGYQPWWLFALVFGLGLVVVVPVAVNDYWIITTRGIELYSYSDKLGLKLRQLVSGHPEKVTFDYAQLQRVTLRYQVRQRPSPFDFNPDLFQLVLTTTGMSRSVNLNAQVPDYLPQLIGLLTRKGVSVLDEQSILPVIVSGRSVYEYFHEKTLG